MKAKKVLLLAIILIILFITSCKPNFNDETLELKIITHDSFSVSEDVIKSFEKKNDVKVVFIQSGDTGSAVNRVILTKDAPLADVFYGIDNTYLTRALEADIFEPYQSELLSEIDDVFYDGTGNMISPVDFGDVCINYDRSYFEENDLSVPMRFEDLLKPEYKDLLVVENPATSSPGLAFLLATVSYFGPGDYLDYWDDLSSNGVVVVNDWETAYYSNFSGSSGKGLQPMVVSYGSSPPAEVIYAEEKLDEAPTASITSDQMCFRQVEYAGIIKGTKNRDLAEKFIDFLLDVPFQEDMPLQMFVFPVNNNAELPNEFILHTQIPDKPAQVDPIDISENREKWIQEWTDVVLK